MAAHPDASNTKTAGPYYSLDYAPFPVVFRMYEKLGATLYNMPATDEDPETERTAPYMVPGAGAPQYTFIDPPDETQLNLL